MAEANFAFFDVVGNAELLQKRHAKKDINVVIVWKSLNWKYGFLKL